jgi:hypothetical protein
MVLKEKCNPTCQRVLSHENTDDSNVGRARPLRPPDTTVDTGTVDECSKDELSALELRSSCEDSNDEGSGAKRMPPDGDIIQVLEDAHAKGVDCTCIWFSRGVPR